MNLGSYADETPPGRLELPGGAVLLTVPLAGAHSVALGVWVRRGTQDEPPGLGGVCHFLEHMVFKGSTTRSTLDIAAGFDALGAAVDAFTAKDHVAFTVRVLAEYLPPAAEILADMLLRPALDPDMVALEREVVCEEIQEALDTPEDFLHDAFAARVYGPHPRALPILGTRETVSGLDAATLRREHERLMAGPNLVIVMAGDIDARARDLVARLFDAPPANRAPRGAAHAGPPPAPPPANGGGRLELRGPLVQSYFEIGGPAIAYAHPDRTTVNLLANLLGGGMSSRVFQAVREREGLAYTIGLDTDLGRDAGLVSCAGSCSPAKLGRVEELVRGEYARLMREGAGREELAANQAQFKANMVFALEGVMGQLARAARDELYFGRFVRLPELVAELDAVDADAIARAAELYFHPDRLVVATHGPGA